MVPSGVSKWASWLDATFAPSMALELRPHLVASSCYPQIKVPIVVHLTKPLAVTKPFIYTSVPYPQKNAQIAKQSDD